MPDPQAVDFASIVLLFGNITGTPNILELSENARYEFIPPEGEENGQANWRGSQSDTLTAPFLAFTFGQHIYSPEGWIVGSSDDTGISDLQVTEDEESGISKKHFRIDIDPESEDPRLTVLSNNLVRIHDDSRTVNLRQGESTVINSVTTIYLGVVTLRAWRPTLTNEEKRRYFHNAEHFNSDFLDALPKLPITLDVPEASTFDIRYGKQDAVYTRLGPRGTGSFGSVMQVKEKKSNKLFAAKEPHFRDLTCSSAARLRWESLTEEFKKLVELKHPHIVQAIEVVTAGPRNTPPWLIMEWMDHDLSAIKLDGRDLPTLFDHVLRGLEYIHIKGFTHRDLKPANILVQLYGGKLTSAKIADFGVTTYNEMGQMETFTGTGAYMAPEFFDQKRAYTNAIDLWAFGIIALELLTGWKPRTEGAWDPKWAPTKSQHQNWLQTILLPKVETAPQKYKPFLLGLLSTEAEERWTAVEAGNWLRKISDADNVARGRAKGKRSAPTNEDSEDSDGPSNRRLRSNNPTLSPTRAEKKPAACSLQHRTI